MALSDCYVLRDIQTYDNEVIENVYFYQDLLLASTAQNVVEAWVLGVLPKVKDIQTAKIQHTIVDCVNMADNENFFEQRIEESGNFSVATLPAHDAIAFGLRLNTRAVRPGSKRICGLGETYTTDNLITDSTFLTRVEAYRAQLSDILLSGVLETFQPIVVGRVRYNPDPEDLTHFAYRLPETDEEFRFGNITEALFNNRVSHQVSRGNGR